MITSEGIYVCPILIDEPRARLGDRLGEASALQAKELLIQNLKTYFYLLI
ncbi:MAG: hypothetical protein V3T96_00355 [Thermodesulfobacteriota bacterium]